MEPDLQDDCSGVAHPELGSPLCVREQVEWGASQGSSSSSQTVGKVDKLRINSPVISRAFLSNGGIY